MLTKGFLDRRRYNRHNCSSLSGNISEVAKNYFYGVVDSGGTENIYERGCAISVFTTAKSTRESILSRSSVILSPAKMSTGREVTLHRGSTVSSPNSINGDRQTIKTRESSIKSGNQSDSSRVKISPRQADLFSGSTVFSQLETIRLRESSAVMSALSRVHTSRSLIVQRSSFIDSESPLNSTREITTNRSSEISSLNTSYSNREKIASRVSTLTSLTSVFSGLFVPSSINPFKYIAWFYEKFIASPIIKSFATEYVMENPVYLKQENLSCIKSDTMGVYKFTISAVDEDGAAVLNAFSGITIDTEIIKSDGTAIDDALIVESSVEDNVLTIEISQDKSVTTTYPVGNYAWFLSIVFSDGIKRTFYKGDFSIFKEKIQ